MRMQTSEKTGGIIFFGLNHTKKRESVSEKQLYERCEDRLKSGLKS